MARSTHPNLTVPDGSVEGATAVSGHPMGSVPLNLLLSLRPGQWTKNFLVFAGLIFAVRLFDPVAVLTAIEAFVIFCGLSGAVYLINDVADRESDRRHPLKRQRPIAAGVVSVRLAVGTAAVLLAVSH